MGKTPLFWTCPTLKQTHFPTRVAAPFWVRNAETGMGLGSAVADIESCNLQNLPRVGPPFRGTRHEAPESGFQERIKRNISHFFFCGVPPFFFLWGGGVSKNDGSITQLFRAHPAADSPSLSRVPARFSQVFTAMDEPSDRRAVDPWDRVGGGNGCTRAHVCVCVCVSKLSVILTCKMALGFSFLVLLCGKSRVA